MPQRSPQGASAQPRPLGRSRPGTGGQHGPRTAGPEQDGKSLCPRAVLRQAPSNAIRSGGEQEGAQGAQKSPPALTGASWLPRATRAVWWPRFHLSDTTLRAPEWAATPVAEIYIASLRDGADLGRAKYKHKLIKNCIMEPYRNTVEKQINTSAAGAAMVPLPPSDRLVTSNYKP